MPMYAAAAGDEAKEPQVGQSLRNRMAVKRSPICQLLIGSWSRKMKHTPSRTHSQPEAYQAEPPGFCLACTDCGQDRPQDMEPGVELMSAERQRLVVFGIPDASQTEAGRPKQVAAGSAMRRVNCLLRTHGCCSPSQAVLFLRRALTNLGRRSVTSRKRQ